MKSSWTLNGPDCLLVFSSFFFFLCSSTVKWHFEQSFMTKTVLSLQGEETKNVSRVILERREKSFPFSFFCVNRFICDDVQTGQNSKRKLMSLWILKIA